MNQIPHCFQKDVICPVRKTNDGCAGYFEDDSYLAMLTGDGALGIASVIVEPACRRHRQVPNASKGGLL